MAGPQRGFQGWVVPSLVGNTWTHEEEGSFEGTGALLGSDLPSGWLGPDLVKLKAPARLGVQHTDRTWVL